MKAIIITTIHRFTERVSILLGRQRVQFIAGTVVAMAGVMLLVAFATADDGRTIFGPQLGPDYACYYVAGNILNSPRPQQLYNVSLQNRLYHQLFPTVPEHMSVPYLNAPFFAVLVRPLALLPYKWSFSAWLVIGLALYIAGLRLLWHVSDALAEFDFVLVLLVAVSFLPFLMTCWMNGQSSAIGFFAISLAIWLQNGRHEIAGGAVLALCLYKPPQVGLILLMLAMARRGRMLVGFLLGGIGLAGISVAAIGWEGCRSYVELLLNFTEFRRNAPEVFRSWIFVDAFSFLNSLITDCPAWLWGVTFAVVAGVLIMLARIWRQAKPGWSVSFQLSWACALAWTPLLSGYFGIYDTVIIVPAAMLTANAMKQANLAGRRPLTPAFHTLLAIIYVTTWMTQPMAWLV